MSPTPPSNPPSFEQQLSFLNYEMGTSNGGNVTNQFQNNPGMSVSQATTIFENRYERAGGHALNTRINNANIVFNSSQSGTLTSISPNVSSAFTYLTGQGYSPQIASGIVGNLMAESGSRLDPTAFNTAGGGNGAFGIAQWRADRQANVLGWDGTAIIPSEVFNPDNPESDNGTPNAPNELLEEDATLVEDAQTARGLANGRATVGDATSNYEDNILNQFESYTYSWAVHMVHPQKADEFEQNLLDGTFITLAESGVENEISIENVIQQTQLAFVRENRNAVSNSFDITFLEPMGFTFFNRIILAAKELKIANHLEACYLLELNFRGWKSDGTAIEDETIGPYYYMTTITDFKIKHRESATTYQTTFIETRYEAYNGLEYNMRSDIVVQASNFGEFLTNFTTGVNDESEKQTATSASNIYPTVYKFGATKSAEEWISWEFDAVAGTASEESRNISMSGAGGTITFTFAKGTSMTAAIAAALLQTKQFKRIPLVGANQFAKESSNLRTVDAPKLVDLMKWFSFQTEIKYLTFDKVSRQYQKELTFNVQAYIVPEGIHDPDSYAVLSLDPDLQQKRLDNIYRNGLLKKRFDYTYTGLNTEVLDLDIAFDMMYFVTQPINGGGHSGQGRFFNGLSAEEDTAITASTSYQAILSEIQELDRQIAQFTNLDPRGVLQIPGREDQRRADILSELEERKRNLEVAETDAAAAVRALTYTPTLISKTAQKYITQSDLFSNSTRFNDAIAQSVNFNYRSVSDSLASSGVDTLDDIGTALLGSLELNLNRTGDMVNQRIQVRGDPYWLGKPKGAGVSNSNQADYDVGGVGYFLNVRFPVFEGEDGFMNQELTNFSITAIYRVLSVTSTYSMGEFKQTLDSYRDTNTNIPALIEQLESGKIVNQGPRNIQQTYVDDNGQINAAPTGTDTDVTDNSGRLDPNASGNAPGNVSGSTAGVDNRLLAAMGVAGAETGLDMVVTSGNRGPGDSGRHNGFAADSQLRTSDGRVLSVENPADLALIQNYTQSFLNATRAAGLTPSVGIANPAYGSGSELYMSGTSHHFDIAMTPGIGSNLSSNAAPYWGGSKRTKHHRPPTWLVNMYNS